MSHGVGCRHGLDLASLCQWCRPAVVTLIQPLAWELTYATGAALKRKKKMFILHITPPHTSKYYNSECDC